MSELENCLRRWRRQRWGALWSEGGARFSALLAGYLLAVLLADRFFVLRQDWRWGLFALGASAFLAGAWRHLLSPLRALDAAALLRAVSERYPQLREYLLSAWELGRSKEVPGTSRALAEEHLRRTEKILRGLNGDNPFPWAPSKTARKRFFSVAACWAVGFPMLGAEKPHFQRILAPWLDTPLEERLLIAPGDGHFPLGDSVEIHARWKTAAYARPPALWARSETDAWAAVAWDRTDQDGFFFSVRSLTAEFEYRLEHDGIRTRSFKLIAVPAPRLLDLSARVQVPGAGPQLRELELEGSGRIAALRRSWVVVRGRESRPLSKAELEISFLPSAIAMRPKGGGYWEGGFPLNEDGRMRILVRGDDDAVDPAPVSYTLRALDDAPPRAVLLSPAFALEISRKEILPVAYEAADDYGLSDISLIYSIAGGGGETVIPLKSFRDHPRDFLGDFNWDLSGFPVGALLEFRIRAMDAARPSAQTAVSEKGVLRIVDFESAHAKTAMTWLGAEASLARLAEREAAMQKFLEELQSTRPADAPALLSAAESDLDAEWKETLGRMDFFAEAMKQDAYANPGMTEAAAAIKQALESLRRNEREDARRAAAQGSYNEAGERHAALEKKIKRAGEMLNEGRELQAMQDFWGEAQRMENQGKEIAGAVDALAAMAKQGQAPTAEQKRALDEAMAQLREKLAAMQEAIQKLPETEEDSRRADRRKEYKVPLLGAKEKMDALQEAIAKGDYEAAAQIARGLAAQLERVHEAIAKAAQDQARGGDNSPSQRMENIAAQWKEAVARQQEGLGVTDALERGKIEGRMREQKKLLRELAEKQRAALLDAASAGPAMPLDAHQWMRETLEEFVAEKVDRAPGHLARAVARLQGRARAAGVSAGYAPLLETAAPGSPPWSRLSASLGKAATDGDRLAAISRQEEEILAELKKGADEPPLGEEYLSQSFAASAVQKQASRKAEELRGELQSLSEDFGLMPGEAQRSLDAARAEQDAAERSLADRDSSAARGHQQKALEHLSQGKKSLEESMQQQQSIAQGSGSPFSRSRGLGRPMGRGGSTGTDQGFVPLPGAEDYQPPRRIRDEVERSLREKRPREFGPTVDEYLKRMSQ